MTTPPALLADGFRPFFLLAGVQAVVGMTVWTASLQGVSWLAPGRITASWHAHEMLFGFIAAAVAGFLLTAVPSWTGRAPFAGRALGVLVAIWLAGRLASIPSAALHPALVAIIDAAFYPALAIAVTPALIAARARRNLVIVAILSALFLTNCLTHLPALEQRLGVSGELLATDVMMVLVALIGGRVVPAFTANALRARGLDIEPAPFGALDRAALGATVAVLLADLAFAPGRVTGAVALTAGVLHVSRLARWHTIATLRAPIVWVLHLGYAWLALGLCLEGLWLLWHPPWAAGWLHAVTAGAFATMILAIMTRAALGHTGRALHASPAVVAAYVLVTAAAATRVLGPWIFPSAHHLVLSIAAFAWIAAFSLYCIVFAPILARPRLAKFAG